MLEDIEYLRHAWICGRYGGGKTALALHLADRYIASGRYRYVALNMPLNVDVPVVVTRRVQEVLDVQDAVIVMDEAGGIIDSQVSPRQVADWLKWLAKDNRVLLMPSVLPVHKNASTMRVQRIFNGSSAGVPLWVYRWRYRLPESSDTGLYWWPLPTVIFGLYDREYKPGWEWFIYDFADQGDGGSSTADSA